MDTKSVGTADSERTGTTPIFDELVGRYGLKLNADALVSTPAGEPAVENGTRDEVAAAS
jgi:hypothetical protein